MLRVVRSHLTYANMMATGAMFVALGGGAYALNGRPDSGVFHGCVSNRTGALRVVKRANSCAKAHGRGRHGDPGETAISWSQQGPRGQPGLQGTIDHRTFRRFADLVQRDQQLVAIAERSPHASGEDVGEGGPDLWAGWGVSAPARPAHFDEGPGRSQLPGFAVLRKCGVPRT
jgi:hypothetical protein